MKYFKNIGLFTASIALFVGCSKVTQPKPQAYLSLEYPNPLYKAINLPLPFTFNKNSYATNVKVNAVKGDYNNGYGVTLEYPNLKGSIYLTYKPVKNNKEVLAKYLNDAQNFTLEHTIKANEIIEQPYQNKQQHAYGMFYEVGGNAASQAQFYLTDSVTHFLTGSLYFYAKPNYDSILPAAHYLRSDIKYLMETLRWKE